MEAINTSSGEYNSDKRNFKRTSHHHQITTATAGTGIFKLKSCSSCGHSFGLFLSRGYSCRKCGQKICKRCKVYDQHASNWNCIMCSKNMGNLKENNGLTSKKENIPQVKRSWSISVPNRSSPVLKSYIKFSDEKQFYSLPRMSSEKISKRITDEDGIDETKDEKLEYTHLRNSMSNNAIHSLQFQTTLHPFSTQVRKSPSSSINFIEDEFWDYYDYEVNRSNRSSCERSLGETMEYQHFFLPTKPIPPKKPERRKSKSLGSFDTKYSQLKTYCIISKKDLPNEKNKTTMLTVAKSAKDVKDDSNNSLTVSQLYYSSLPRKLPKTKAKDDGNENENNNNIIVDNMPTPTPRRRSHNGKFLKKDNDKVHILGGTLPKNYKQTVIMKDRNGNNNLFEAYKFDTQNKTGQSFDTYGWYSSLPPSLSSKKNSNIVGKVTRVSLTEPKSLMDLPYGNASCSCESAECIKNDVIIKSPQKPSKHANDTTNFTNKIVINSGGQTCNIMTSNNNNLNYEAHKEKGQEKFYLKSNGSSCSCSSKSKLLNLNSGDENKCSMQKREEWQHKLLQLKRDYNSINKNVINASDNNWTHKNREIIIPIQKEFENKANSNIQIQTHKDDRSNIKRPNDEIKQVPISAKIKRNHETLEENNSDNKKSNTQHKTMEQAGDDNLLLLNDLPPLSRSSSTSSFVSNNNEEISDPFQECNFWSESDTENCNDIQIIKQELKKVDQPSYLQQDEFKSCEELDSELYSNFTKGEQINNNFPQLDSSAIEEQQQRGVIVVTPFSSAAAAAAADDDDAIVNGTGEGLLKRLSDQGLNSKNMVVDNILVSNYSKNNKIINNLTTNEVMNNNSTNKKYKSRILINSTDNHIQDNNNGAIKVEIIEGQVGIVTGSSLSFLTGDNDNEQLCHKVLVKPIDNFHPGQDEVNNLNITYDLNSEQKPEHSEKKYERIPENDNKMTAHKFITSNYKSNCNASLLNESPNNRQQTLERKEKLEHDVNSIISCRRESPEGQESQEIKTPDPNKHSMARYSPIGADKSEDGDGNNKRPKTPVLQVKDTETSAREDEEGEDSTDSWTEEISFEEEAKPPLDLTLHTIVEESCEESEPETTTSPTNKSNKNELEKYYNFSIENEERPSLYEESEFSDTFSESESLCSELRNDVDPAELASGRLEKYFMNLGLNNESDSVGSESESDSSVLENRKKVLKHHHRRSAEYDDDTACFSEDEECIFEQEGFDTIKKQRKLRKSSEDLLEEKNELMSNSTPAFVSQTILTKTTEQNNVPVTLTAAERAAPTNKQESAASVSRSNSFTWSSDEEVNLMMSKLRELVKNVMQNKKVDDSKDEKLVYLESELVRLMRSENIKNIVDNISSDSDDDVYKLFEKVETNQPELLSKVMSHIGERLSTWMKDEDELIDDAATIKCAPSVSSDLNEDRFSWKGSFESALAKRQSVGSTDSLDYGGATAMQDDVYDRSILRSSSLHHLANSQPILEESGDSLTNSLPRLNNPQLSNINRAKSLFINEEIKSARYRPPGYFEKAEKENHASTPLLHEVTSEGHHEIFDARDLTQSSNIKVRGQIEFSMQYDYKHSCFEIKIQQCRDLAAADIKRGRSDPYVKVYLLPDRTKSSKRKTKIKKNSLNPIFGEVLKFPISLEELENRNLWLSVWHSDLFGKNEFLGQIVINLKSITFDDTSYRWFSLGDKDSFQDTFDDISQSIDLVLALKWTASKTFAKGDLVVLIKEAKGVKCIKSSYPSTFVKCVPLTDKSKKQKTVLCRKSLNPTWNTTLVFENVSNNGIELSIYNYDLLNHELLGSVKLDSSKDLWKEMLAREKFWVEGVVTF